MAAPSSGDRKGTGQGGPESDQTFARAKAAMAASKAELERSYGLAEAARQLIEDAGGPAADPAEARAPAPPRDGAAPEG